MARLPSERSAFQGHGHSRATATLVARPLEIPCVGVFDCPGLIVPLPLIAEALQAFTEPKDVVRSGWLLEFFGLMMDLFPFPACPPRSFQSVRERGKQFEGSNRGGDQARQGFRRSFPEARR